MVIQTKEGNHIAAQEMYRLRSQVKEWWTDQLNKGETIVAVDNWSIQPAWPLSSLWTSSP